MRALCVAAALAALVRGLQAARVAEVEGLAPAGGTRGASLLQVGVLKAAQSIMVDDWEPNESDQDDDPSANITDDTMADLLDEVAVDEEVLKWVQGKEADEPEAPELPGVDHVQ
mmetsp:Transcript_25622/g.69799  ORF Transcript_25622/g.69799 Transcript_25622/m.69799 type:complete len:114 (-) Transcript_25622:8-349(-)